MLDLIGSIGHEWVSAPNTEVVTVIERILQTNPSPTIAEIGIGIGATTIKIMDMLNGRGRLHIFDFDYKIKTIFEDFTTYGHDQRTPVVGHGNTTRVHDSYAWSLAKLAQSGERLDLAFLDGSHTFENDAAACCILKEMMQPGGYIVFDDLNWTLAGSPTMNPTAKPATAAKYSDEQIATAHVKLVVDLFMRNDPRFTDVSTSKSRAVFQRN